MAGAATRQQRELDGRCENDPSGRAPIRTVSAESHRADRSENVSEGECIPSGSADAERPCAAPRRHAAPSVDLSHLWSFGRDGDGVATAFVAYRAVHWVAARRSNVLCRGPGANGSRTVARGPERCPGRHYRRRENS